MNSIKFIIIGLAIWRISSLFVKEDGPFFVFRRLRKSLEPYPDMFLGQVLSCVWCFSIYVGVFFSLAFYVNAEKATLIALPFAFSAIAIIINLLVEKMLQW